MSVPDEQPSAQPTAHSTNTHPGGQAARFGRFSSCRPFVGVGGHRRDITLIPLTYLEQIEAPELDEVRLRSHWGHTTTVTTYLVDIELSTSALPGLEVVGDLYADEIVLGRDVLNRLLLLIDGPRQITDILLRRPHTR